MGEQPAFSPDDLEFAEIIQADPETAILVTPIPLWDVAIGSPMARKVNIETMTAVYEDCACRMETARAENRLFSDTLKQLYIDARRLFEGRPNNHYHTRSDTRFNIAAAARITTDLPNPARAIEIMAKWETAEYRGKVDVLVCRALEKLKLSDELPDYIDREMKEFMIKDIEAGLDPEQRAAAYKLVLETIYGARYDAYKATQA